MVTYLRINAVWVQSMDDFRRIKRLPPYVFNIIDDIKLEYIKRGIEIIDFGMGNPDQVTPKPIIDRLCHSVYEKDACRYSASRGILRLRQAICDWYFRHFNVSLNPETESIVTIGSKEGIAHLALATTGPGDTVLVPTPSYPIHTYGFVIAGANVVHVPLQNKENFFHDLEQAIKNNSPIPKMIVLNFPANPTTQCVEIDFFEKVIQLAKEYRIWVLQDFAYADLAFDNYQPPSILQVEGAKEVAVETFSLSKSYNMPGWRIGFVNGNEKLINALARIKSYMDYGTFTPIQEAAITALESEDKIIHEVKNTYQQRRDVLCQALQDECQWFVEKPKATMFVWAKIPEPMRNMGSLKFCEFLIQHAGVALSPGIGFGELADEYVRFSLVQDIPTIHKATKKIGHAFIKF